MESTDASGVTSVLDHPIEADVLGTTRPATAPPAQGRPLRQRVRSGAVDPLVVGLVALAIYAAHGYQGQLNRDLGVFTYGGEHVARGVPPYVGIFNSVGPLADALPGLAIWVGHGVGLGPVLSARLFFTLLSVVCCSLVCVLGRDTFGRREAGLVAAAVFLTFEEFIELASGGPREKTAMLVFLLAAVTLVQRRRWTAAGVATALATLTWQPSLFVAVAAIAAAALPPSGGRRWRCGVLARFVAGGAAAAGATAGLFLALGALRPAIDGLVSVNLLYTHQPSAFSAPGATWRVLWNSYHASLVAALVGLVLLLVRSAWAVPDVRRPHGTGAAEARRLVIVGAGAAGGAAWTISVINGGPDLFVLLPFGALGVAGLVTLVTARLRRRLKATVVTLVVAAGVLSATVESVATRSDLLVTQVADIAAVLGTQPPGSSIVSIGAPQVLAIAQRDNPTPYQLADRRMVEYLHQLKPASMSSFASEIARRHPTFVVVGHHRLRLVDQVLARHYSWVGRGVDWSWYLRRSAGPAALVRSRAANAAVLGPPPSAR